MSSETPGRLLRLLSLLQTPRHWSGAELAERLGVTVRTVRRDVERLRDLGYPVDAERGVAGYRLGAGAELPPLLLDDDEAVAVAIGLRTSAASSVSGIEETAQRALAKLEQVLPSRLRHRVRSLQRATTRVGSGGPAVDPDILLSISEAVNRRETLRFDYRDHVGQTSVRTALPHHLVNWEWHWYLVAWDEERRDWRTFRVDRATNPRIIGPRFDTRELPDADVASYLTRTLSTGPWPARATARMHAPATAVNERIWPGLGAVEAVDDSSCLLHVGAPSVAEAARLILVLGIDFTAVTPPELTGALNELSERCLHAIAGTNRHRDQM